MKRSYHYNINMFFVKEATTKKVKEVVQDELLMNTEFGVTYKELIKQLNKNFKSFGKNKSSSSFEFTANNGYQHLVWICYTDKHVYIQRYRKDPRDLYFPARNNPESIKSITLL